LLVFDDFEKNLTTGGEQFRDPAVGDVLTGLAEAAETGALVVTCRYRVPGPDRLLVQVPVPALSTAELRRMFLRLPALRDLDAADRLLLTRTIGGHPRLIEFTDGCCAAATPASNPSRPNCVTWPAPKGSTSPRSGPSRTRPACSPPLRASAYRWVPVTEGVAVA
jgi:hypothetical protein